MTNGPATQSRKHRSRLHCHDCPTQVKRRTDLDALWRCPSCAAKGTRGYADPMQRGLDPRYGGETGADYFDRTRDQLRVVDDDASCKSPRALPTKKAAAPSRAATLLRQWDRDVCACLSTALSDGAKVLAHVIATHADWETGEDAWPKLATLAGRTGKSLGQVRALIGELHAAGYVDPRNRRLHGRQTSNEYRLRWPDGRAVSDADGTAVHAEEASQ